MKLINIIATTSLIIFCMALPESAQNNVIKNNSLHNTGTVVFQFRRDPNEKNPDFNIRRFAYDHLGVLIKINNEIALSDLVKSGESYKINLPEGEIKIEYSIYACTGHQYFYYSDVLDNSDCFDNQRKSLDIISKAKEKELKFNIKNNQTVFLKIVDIGEPVQKCVWVNYGFFIGSHQANRPFQEVAFEVEKIEESTSGDLKNDKSQ